MPSLESTFLRTLAQLETVYRRSQNLNHIKGLTWGLPEFKQPTSTSTKLNFDW